MAPTLRAIMLIVIELLKHFLLLPLPPTPDPQLIMTATAKNGSHSGGDTNEGVSAANEDTENAKNCYAWRREW